MGKQNYWTITDAALLEILAERGLTVEDKSRKTIIEALQKWDMEHGEAEEVMEATDKGLKTVEDNAWTRMSDAEKELWKLRTVIFHDLYPTDPPYVFIGHNGRAFYFPKDKEVVIPQIFLDSVIKDAVEHRMEAIGSGRNMKFQVKKIQRVPYSLVK